MTAGHALLRIYTDETAYCGDRKVFEIVAERARDARLAGATVIEAMIGFGRSAHMHRRHISRTIARSSSSWSTRRNASAPS